MMMKKLAAFSFMLLSLQVFAASQTAPDSMASLRAYIPYMTDGYMARVDAYNTDPSHAVSVGSCDSMYARIEQKKSIDIHYAFGYFDGAEGKDVIIDGADFGIAPSYDYDYYYGFIGALTKACPNGTRKLCGFSLSGDPDSGRVILEKTVNLLGSPTLVHFTLTRASASVSYARNLGELATQQKLFTAQSEDNLFGGLKDGDVVFYNGHSRNGGGPDFAPPVLNKHGTADYNGYYLVRRTGIKKLAAGLATTDNRGLVLGLFSCFGAMHFLAPLTKINPDQKMILGIEPNVPDLNFNTSLMASMGYLEGILQGRCGSDLVDEATRASDVQKAFSGFNL